MGFAVLAAEGLGQHHRVQTLGKAQGVDLDLLGVKRPVRDEAEMETARPEIRQRAVGVGMEADVRPNETIRRAVGAVDANEVADEFLGGLDAECLEDVIEGPPADARVEGRLEVRRDRPVNHTGPNEVRGDGVKTAAHERALGVERIVEVEGDKADRCQGPPVPLLLLQGNLNAENAESAEGGLGNNGKIQERLAQETRV